MTRKSDVHERTLLAPCRSISDYPMRSGYEMGIAATAGAMRFDFDLMELDLEDDAVEAVACALEAIEQARRGFLWRRPLTEDEIIAMDIGEFLPSRTAAERVRDQLTKRQKIRAAVAAGDIALPALARYGLVLTVSTYKEEFAPVPASVAPPYPYSAIVFLMRV
jgi:hypothetical protein